MIVVCPCCQRRYRHDFESDRSAPTARCSACDERFPLAPPNRSYVLAVGGETSTAPRLPFGLDACAASATAEATGADDGRVIADDLSVATHAETVSSVEIELPAADDLSPTEDATETVAEVSRVEPAASAERVTDARPRAARLAGSILEGLVAFLPGGIGAGMAYHFAGPWDQDPVVWGALGGAIGLLLGWACLLWITRGD